MYINFNNVLLHPNADYRIIQLVCLGKLFEKDLTRENTAVSTCRSGGTKLKKKDIFGDSDVADSGNDSDGKLHIRQKLIYTLWFK